MKYSIIKIFSIAVLTGIMFTSCKKDFLDVNDDPNRVTELNVTPELIFPQAATATGARNASLNVSFLHNWLGYWATSGSYAIDQSETSYNISFSFTETFWRGHYNVLFDLYKTKTKALAKGDSVLAGAAMILSVRLWQDLVDCFGNIPYRQAFQNNSYRQPEYDDAKEIYNMLQLSLDSAKGYMHHTARAAFQQIDLVNQGNVTQWIKLANTLKLRLLVHQSEVTGFHPAAEIQKIKDGGAGLNILQAGETVSVNPGYVDELTRQSPFYANYGFSPTGGEANSLTRANAYFVNLLTNTSDPRIEQYFGHASSGSIVGTVYGLATGNPTGNAASGMGPGLVKSADQDQWIFTDFESMFLEAEAIARGWVTGDAQAVYEHAVERSFVFLEVPDAQTEAQHYLSTQRIASWANAGGTAASKARFIAYQKYIALAGIDAVEVYADLRRLNFLPNNGYISVNPARVSNTLPVRLPYPQSEYTANSNNVNAQGSNDIFTNKIFWQP
jgi:hypothetical protein